MNNKTETNEENIPSQIEDVFNKKINNPSDLYYDVEQIKTFSNVKKVVLSNNPITENQIENLLNDEILFFKILIDLKKITFIVDEIIKRLNIQHLYEIFDNFYNLAYLKNNIIVEEINKINKEIFNDSMNLSTISVNDIMRSEVFYSYLKEFLECYKVSIKKNQPISNINKGDVILKNYPVFPNIIPCIVQKNNKDSEDIRLDVYQKANFYKCSNDSIRTQISFEKFLTLKSTLKNQNRNINIFEFNEI